MTQIPASKSTGGVLQIPIAATQKNASTTAPKKAPKPAAPRLKLVVRRLPPGLTQAEFEAVLGDEWKVGGGKVDWLQYKAGKVSKDPAKPSRPSRAYIHVVSNDHSVSLSDKVRAASFVDARNTSNDPILLGPPSLEFAPYAKIPGSRIRKDARQGTIDQDPDFIAFLESLTQPITKAPAVESAADADDRKEKKAVTTTPLVQYIKDKKANKAKEASKSSKHSRGDKESKAEKVQAKKLLQRGDKESGANEKPEKKSKADKATKDAVKAANKQAANLAKQASKSSTAQNSPKETASSTPTSDRKRERGNFAAATKILQRDLGLAPSGGSGRRRGGKGASADTDAAKAESRATSTETGKKDKRGKAKGGGAQPSDAVPSSRAESTLPASSTPTAGKSSKAGKGKQAPPTPATTATQAFLKHANPSQGVTEPLLETAFAPFGKVVKVEIDKKKGFGYVDFAEPDGLQKAIAASPVTVAQSQVVVLERKMNPSAEKSRGKTRSENQAANASSNGNNNNTRGAKAGEGGSGSSRGHRGGRGSKKGGPKANGGGNNSNGGDSKAGESK
ncbi:hypothetical protein FE257_004335 [Aspergillus nanangensis]|uniref:RRM domain-containing protein n=1 Tax=Aspergillus nanangensis TaxID=2582783 RepID=A0AAD4CC16_ASPNN|nr:hypothetical protein FE257_004335 [Aspergillus nanangensis]